MTEIEGVLQGLMQHQPLTLDRVIRRMETVTANSRVVAAGATGTTTTRFATVAGRTRQLASALAAAGIRHGDRVATLGFNTEEHLELFLGVPAAGAVLHTINPRLGPDQLNYVLRHGGARIAFVDAAYRVSLAEILSSAPELETVVYLGSPPEASDGYQSFIDRGSAEAGDELVDELAAAGLCYTSGTTGNPKGVLYSHRSTFLHALSTCLVDGYKIGRAQTILPIVPLFHANGWGIPHAAGMTGANLVLPGRDVSGASIGRLIHDEQVTITSGVPTVLTELLSYADQNPGTLDSLRFIISGGAPLTVPLVEHFADRHGVEVVQGWGMTETSPNVSMSWPPPGVDGTAADRYRAGSGRLNPLVDARLVDSAGAELPWDGESAGEIQLRSPHAANGYFNEPEASAELMDDGWMKTGDLASIDADGYIQLRDRIKDLIKSGGEWIPTVELEHHLRTHSQIVDAAVVAVADERWGERPRAFVIVSDANAFDREALEAHLLQRMPKWWLPRDYRVVSEFPLTTIGKVDKKALRDESAEETAGA